MAMTREQYKKKFEEFDKDNDGKLTLAELHQHIEDLLHTHVSDMAAQFLFDSMDTSKDGYVTKEEWLDALDKKSLKEVGKDDLRETFKKIDKSGDGKLSKSEIKATMKGNNPDMTDEQLDELINASDKDHDGEIDIEEFIEGFFSNK